MEKIKVRVIEYFKDSITKTYRKIGEEFECDKKRCDYLLEHNVVEIVEDIQEITEKEVQAVAEAIVLEAKEQEKTVEEIVDEIVEETVDEVIEEISTKKRKKSSKVVE